MIAAPVALGSVAYACQSLATLHANPGTVAAGGAVNVYGKNYSATTGTGVTTGDTRSSGAGTGASNVVIHLDGRNGPAIASLSVGVDRGLNTSVTVPAGTAVGNHTLVATQYTAAGDAVSGTPGRAALTITVAARTTADGGAAAPVSASSATPAAATVTPAAAPAAATPAASAASAATATAPAATSTAAASTAPSAATAAPTAAAASTTASAAVAATAATPAGPAASDAAATTPTAVNVGGILPAAATHGSSLPGLTLVAGLALVVLALGAFAKSGKSMLGRGFAPLAG